jgi:hypothetical protein
MLHNLESFAAIAGKTSEKPGSKNTKNNPAKNYVPNPGHIIH